MILTTDRLVLRAPMPTDVDAMFAAYSDPRAMRYWSTAPHETATVTQDLLDRCIAWWAIQPVNFHITINDMYIGSAGNFRGDEIGFMLHPDYWRQGILTEAMQAIIPYLWEVTDHTQLTADADPNNTASVRLLQKLGFHETHRAEKTFVINGVWSDSVYFARYRPAL
ncbi:GNAT family N-acetyltransferase [Yoonia sp.]|uniref:GNAT family N-acetyltransferase n=1 Tax=Yoonia sp. TaxID=2212373 RepID=UPI0025E76451|nr:GNAT family N-acetyltransferase [Yoonia sp.]